MSVQNDANSFRAIPNSQRQTLVEHFRRMRKLREEDEESLLHWNMNQYMPNESGDADHSGNDRTHIYKTSIDDEDADFFKINETKNQTKHIDNAATQRINLTKNRVVRVYFFSLFFYNPV